MKKVTIIAVIILVILMTAGVYYYVHPDLTIKVPSDKGDLIVVVSPIKDSIISSPLTISGRARGSWYFEGSFPLVLTDSYGNTIAEGHATAQGSWTTNEFVKFIGNLQFSNYIKGSKGVLILKKDNPSGLIENDDSIEIPIVFK